MAIKMTASRAVEILGQAFQAVTYLEEMAQASVNHNGKAIAESVKKNEDVDGSDMFVAWKDKKKVSKTLSAITQVAKYGDMVAKYEAKLAAIETTVAPKSVKLGLIKA